MQETTFKKIKEAEPMGEYKPTAIDERKKEVDFLLLQVRPSVIKWKDGKTQLVTRRQLYKLMEKHTFMCDF